MTLKLTVKPGERFFIGRAEVCLQSDMIINVMIEGDAAVLREEDHISKKRARSTAQQLHYVVQQMYLTGDTGAYHVEYFTLAQRLISEDPDATSVIADVNRFLIDGQVYKAIKLLKCIYDPSLTRNTARLRLLEAS